MNKYGIQMRWIYSASNYFFLIRKSINDFDFIFLLENQLMRWMIIFLLENQLIIFYFFRLSYVQMVSK
jgi:hypothetical protein